MEIEGVAALVTGAGSGMGEMTAQHLAGVGAKVSLVDLNEDRVRDVAKRVGGVPIVCDVSNPASAEEAVAKAAEMNGPARILVNCAGVGRAKRIVGREGPMPLEEFQRVINTNLVGSFNMLRLAAAAMFPLEPVTASGGKGVIINTASVAAYEGQIGQAAYSASKGGIVSLTLPAAREFATQGIRVMTIAPGLIDTPMMAGMPEEVQESLASQVPFPKRFGRPQEYASLVEHIITNEMLNGEVIRFDGAIRMQPK
jgi:NAD(P)-dependent dehydrogenase (short-subunit alcohol dehydrogenase family)